ncbi:MAG: PIN domain-containing protein [Burkholderiales bacterium]|nr:PIN domain-containing protein [Burkholderiales bacterium]
MKLAATLVVLDTCVLMPPRLSDVLMDLRGEELFSLHWTTAIEVEYLRNMQTAFGFPQEAVRGRLRAMRGRCPEWEVHVSPAARAKVPAKVDPEDGHVAAAALTLRHYVDEERDPAAYQVFLVTDNVRHFARGEMGKLGVEVMKAGAFLDRVYGEHPEETGRAVQRAVSDLSRAPYTEGELLAALEAHGARKLVEGLTTRLGVTTVRRAGGRPRVRKP